MPGPVVALDADVLVPIVACDFLLTAFEHVLYEPPVSITSLDEVERALLADFPHLQPAAIRYRVEAMGDALEDHLVDGEAAEVLEEINPKDRHVVGAALAGEATILATNDRRLRDEVHRALPELRARSLDDFAFELWQRSPDDVAAVVDALVAKRTNPPVRREAILDALQSAVPSMVSRLRPASPSSAGFDPTDETPT